MVERKWTVGMSAVAATISITLTNSAANRRGDRVTAPAKHWPSCDGSAHWLHIKYGARAVVVGPLKTECCPVEDCNQKTVTKGRAGYHSGFFEPYKIAIYRKVIPTEGFSEAANCPVNLAVLQYPVFTPDAHRDGVEGS